MKSGKKTHNWGELPRGEFPTPKNGEIPRFDKRVVVYTKKGLGLATGGTLANEGGGHVCGGVGRTGRSKRVESGIQLDDTRG